MLEIILLSTFILAISLIVYKEYQNTKKYNEERKAYQQKKQTDFPKRTPQKPPAKKTPIKPKAAETKAPAAPQREPEPAVATAEETHVVAEESPVIEPLKESVKPEEIVKEEAPAVELPSCNYPPFDHARTVAMGLSEEEAREFVQELISQIDAQIPLIETQMNIPDFHQMERLTHSIKGSATNLGTGGVSDLLVDFNTYLKSGSDIRVASAYFESLKAYGEKLKEQYL